MTRRSLLFSLAVFLLPSCSTPAASVSADMVPETAPAEILQDASPADRTSDLGQDGWDTGFDSAPLPDVEETADLFDSAPACVPGTGCFGDPCVSGEECLSGICVPHMGDSICSQACIEECPAGFQCKLYFSGPDQMYACVSPHSHLCRPCFTAADCKSPSGAEDVCIDLGPEGSFCGAACLETKDCPEGFSCNAATTTEGGKTMQCVPDDGTCPCSASAVRLALGTKCSVTNEHGTCTGKRFCAGDGLGPCDAPTPAAETCNGLDDDCDSEADEPDLLQGDYVPLCDDANSCTDDSCSGTGGCVHTPLDAAACDDQDACTKDDACAQGLCKGTVVECNDDNACTDDACDPESGCAFSFNWEPCDDGDPCTSGDSCKKGACAGTPVACDCSKDADCAALEDGNLCNGTLFCDLDAFPQKCAVLPGSTVECPAPEGADTYCKKSECVPETGACTVVPDHDGQACEDGNACTVGDQCAAGACQAGQPKECVDGNGCTDDSCDAQLGCVFSPNQAECDDGNACTSGDHCSQGACAFGKLVSCTDGNLCTTDSCDTQLGCLFEVNTLPCDDSNVCTVGDSCSDGVCESGPVKSCDDGNGCTDDSCDAQLGCVFSPNKAECDDGNACTSGDHCSQGSCAFDKLVSCSDGNPCTTDSCDTQLGCMFAVNTLPCDDANACTAGDQCSNGVCKPGPPTGCDDANPCTDDACNPAAGCTHAPRDCDDGDPCTHDFCALASGECQHPAVTTECPPCQTPVCSPLSGQVTCVPITVDCPPCTSPVCSQSGKIQCQPVVCDDNSKCTVDACEPAPGGGSCTFQPVECSDGNLCTDDSCDPASGCAHAPNTVPCDDGDACTVTDACSNATCTGSGKLDCDDGNKCTDDSCDPGSGCVHAPNAAPCDDGDACTMNDVCASGTCKPGSPLSCNDGNPCTADTCTPAGCVYAFSGPCTVQPGPEQGMDHVIGSVYNIDPNGTMDHIRTGGWGDNYWALLQFPIAGMPPVAKKATIRLFGMNDNISPTQMYLDRVTSQWAENCTWGNKPSYTNITTIPPSQVGVWYEIDVTALYNGWAASQYPNYGVQFRSLGTWNNYNGFWSSDYTDDPKLRPMLVVEPK